MARSNYTFTSESVSEGHPDKVSDRISDEVVDLFYRRAAEVGMDPWDVRCAAETLVTTNRVVIAGEMRGPKGEGEVTTEEIIAAARAAIKDIGYEQSGFHHEHAEITVLLHDQSAHIAQGVDDGTGEHKEEGAGDQGIMFGYASNETEALMPAPLYYSHKILEELAKKRHSGELDQLLPDAKSQVSVVYENGKPVRASSIVLSTQHKGEDQTSADIRAMVEPTIRDVLPDGWITDDTVWHVNPTGTFVIGGPDGDAGLTGRKIIVDTYGGAAPHGGGAFSGKDPTKVDRSAAYVSRYLAKNIVAAGIADWCTIQLSYAIGVAQPQSLYVDTGGQADDAKIEKAIRSLMTLTPRNIREKLDLNKPIYAKTAAYGHFGRTPTDEGHFSWEKTDLVDALKAAMAE
ncbi:methionine adenosyltransferase [Ahrensia sp. R2A130]|uniref:methionine adenosyltransferase n=1 Tax=Ahrensia sp. R2A130 TaxID=744979 RepID=UPI0001E0F88B|nr:methionine adenosyltransferase [Ahrensia sp. R2A130]EFL89216.1 methionine adenosyltransferase [Ahrensia sp. R2A130]